MKKISSGNKRKLKSLAHHLKPVVLIGQKGITESLIRAADKALSDHELIKIKFIDLKDEKRELTEKIVEGTGAFHVNTIGNVVILYRDNPEKPDNERIKLK
jgi:RNA-binding protein